MGAEANSEASQVLRPGGLESETLKGVIQTGKGPEKTRALKRLKVINAFLTTNNSPLGMVWMSFRLFRRNCARWFSWTVAVSRPPT